MRYSKNIGIACIAMVMVITVGVAAVILVMNRNNKVKTTDTEYDESEDTEYTVTRYGIDNRSGTVIEYRYYYDSYVEKVYVNDIEKETLKEVQEVSARINYDDINEGDYMVDTEVDEVVYEWTLEETKSYVEKKKDKGAQEIIRIEQADYIEFILKENDRYERVIYTNEVVFIGEIDGGSIKELEKMIAE